MKVLNRYKGTINMNYILASQSPRRRELLGKLGISFEIEPAVGEEVPCGKTPEEIVKVPESYTGQYVKRYLENGDTGSDE